jgi:hypothetical protein
MKNAYLCRGAIRYSSVVVDVDAGFLPDGEFVGQFRQRLEGWLVQPLEEFAAGAAQVLHWPGVELIQ